MIFSDLFMAETLALGLQMVVADVGAENVNDIEIVPGDSRLHITTSEPLSDQVIAVLLSSIYWDSGGDDCSMNFETFQ